MLIYHPQITNIQFSAANEQEISIDMLRLDKIHNDISGNKWFKLNYNIIQAKAENKNTIVTFGGAFSNHIVATAVACQLANLKCIGIIRGEKYEPLNPSLQKARDFGMELFYVNREDYKTKQIPFASNEQHYLIPEGGANLLGVKGCEEIITQELNKYDVICCAAGTGTTAAGILNSLGKHQKLLVFTALKNGNFLKEEIENFSLHKNIDQLEIVTNYSFGGYGKVDQNLVNFVNNFKAQQSIQLDYIYTGKMAFGTYDLIEKQFFAKKTNILLLHSGGTQGNKGIEERYKKYFNNVML